MNGEADALVIAALYQKANRLEHQAVSLQFDAQDLRHQAREIEGRYEFPGPCVGCERYKTCTLAGTCAAIDRCGKARELARVQA